MGACIICITRTPDRNGIRAPMQLRHLYTRMLFDPKVAWVSTLDEAIVKVAELARQLSE